MPLIKEKYEKVAKAEQDRIVKDSFIKSYGKMPVNNKRYNQLVNYLEKVNKHLQVKNPTQNQISLQKTIEQQLNLSRLKILDSYVKHYETSDKSIIENMLFLTGFRNWCGPYTSIYNNIKEDLDDPNRMFKIDTICRNHDIAYTKAQTQQDIKNADDVMIKQVIQKYIFNFKQNFITGNYETDFSNWASSFNTVYNYLLSGIESTFTAGLMAGGYQKAKGVVGSALQIPERVSKFITEFNKKPKSTTPLVSPVKQLYKAISGQYQQSYRTQVYNKYGITATKNFIIGGGSLYLGNIIKDKIFAVITLGVMALKRVTEAFTGFNAFTPTEHDVKEENLEEIIKIFELLQNEYLMESNLEPIKIGDEWEQEKIEIPSVPDLTNDINQIVMMNKEFITKKYELYENEKEPEISEEEIQQSKIFYDELLNQNNELINIILEQNIIQEEAKQKTIDIETNLSNEINNYRKKYEEETKPEAVEAVEETKPEAVEAVEETKPEQSIKYKDEL